MGPWERVDAIGCRQHGAVSRRQVVDEAGVCGRVLTERVRDQGWERPYRGLYLMPGTAATFQRQASAALLAVGRPALLTGHSAAYLAGLVKPEPAEVEIAIPQGRGTRRRPGIVLRRHDADVLGSHRLVDRLPVVSLPLMVVDLARYQDEGSLARTVAAMCARRLTTLERLEEAVSRFGRAEGAAQVRRVLEGLRGELTHSGAERTLRRHVRALGVDVWPRPYPVVHRGRVVAELDLAVPGALYGAEVDGPHHLLPDQIASDKARDRLLGRIGWTIDRFPVDMVMRAPRTVAREIVARLATLGLVAVVEH